MRTKQEIEKELQDLQEREEQEHNTSKVIELQAQIEMLKWVLLI